MSKKTQNQLWTQLLICAFILVIIFCMISTKSRIAIRNRIEDYKWDEVVNGILYINLTNRPDRKEKIEKVLEKAEVPVNLIHRIDAVQNNDCGHIGCAYSHVRALKYAKYKDWSRVLILEDDFEFLQQNSILFKTVTTLPEKFDVFMLASGYSETYPIEPTEFIHKVKWGTTTSGYMVQKHYYNILINCFEEAIKKMEEELKEFKKFNPGKKMYETSFAIDQAWFRLQQKDDFFITVPNIGTQANSPSSIMS